MDELTVRTATISSILFLILIIVVFEVSSGYGSKIHAKEPGDTVIVTSDEKQEEQTIEMNPDDNLVIPIPGTVSKENVTITVDTIGKAVNINFNVNGATFDVANVTNTAAQIAQIEYRSEKDIISIDIVLNDYYETVWCFKDGNLYMRFLAIEKNTAIVMIDPGHGGSDAGANINGIFEKNITMSVCRKLKEMAVNQPFKLYFTREGDLYRAVEERAGFANIIQPDLFVSVHVNWYDDSAVNGTSVLYNSLNGTEIRSSNWLASILDEEVTKSMGIGNKGLVDGKSIYVVRYTKVPAALVELGFMSNEADLNMLTSEEGQNNAAKGLLNGINRALHELGRI